MRGHLGPTYFTSEVTVKSGFILLDKMPIVADTSADAIDPSKEYCATPNDMLWVLNIGHQAIQDGMKEIFERSKANNPGAQIDPPSLFAVRLGFNEREVLTGMGRDNNTSIHSDPREILDVFHPYWFTLLEQTPYIPEVRSRIGSKATEAAWLTIHLDEMPS